MPPRPPKPCKKPGCRALTQEKNGYCEAHQAIAADKELQLSYNRFRGSASSRGYDARWRKIREQILRDEPLCRHCKDNGRISPATHLHHIDEDSKNNKKSNLCPLCFECHEREHGRVK